MDLAARLSSTEVAYPWGEPLPDTDEAKAWSMELDFVDILEGSLEELEELARTAPTPGIRKWLLGVIHFRKMMRGLADWPPPRPAQKPQRDEDEEDQPASQVQPVPNKNPMPGL